ncbi:MAG: hypothetical protein WB764_28130, partial [Xanthobacteraceae bacterium]
VTERGRLSGRPEIDGSFAQGMSRLDRSAARFAPNTGLSVTIQAWPERVTNTLRTFHHDISSPKR